VTIAIVILLKRMLIRVLIKVIKVTNFHKTPYPLYINEKIATNSVAIYSANCYGFGLLFLVSSLKREPVTIGGCFLQNNYDLLKSINSVDILIFKKEIKDILTLNHTPTKSKKRRYLL
jgi:hypothetical protein